MGQWHSGCRATADEKALPRVLTLLFIPINSESHALHHRPCYSCCLATLQVAASLSAPLVHVPSVCPHDWPCEESVLSRDTFKTKVFSNEGRNPEWIFRS